MASTSKMAKKNGEFSTNWNIDSYRTEHESEEHWHLRRKFMEEHKNKFPEDRLVCLAQVFVNMEFMGCKYPAETMKLVSELSKDIAKDFRESRSTKLKRTFITASDAAEARAKGRKKTQHTNIPEKKSKKHSSQPTISEYSDLFKGLPYGKFTLNLIGDRNCLMISAQRCKCKIEEKEIKNIASTSREFGVYLNGVLIAKENDTNVKSGKLKAFQKALSLLQQKCYTIKPNSKCDKISIEKLNNKIVCEVVKDSSNLHQDNKLDIRNKGFQIMKLMGWTGGGLGVNGQGCEEPVGYLLKSNRFGLGKEVTLDKDYYSQILENYVGSDDIRDLQFDSSFTKDERVILHNLSNKFGLKSHSIGTGDSRSLTISKKNLTNERILTEVLLNKSSSFSNKFFVQVPEEKAKMFPEHTMPLSLDMEMNVG